MTRKRSDCRVAVRVSQTISWEYETRSVFNGHGEYLEDVGIGLVYVRRETAEMMLSDAEYNGDSREGPSEMPLAIGNAYRALAKQLRKALA